jgi:hypothetical protein
VQKGRKARRKGTIRKSWEIGCSGMDWIDLAQNRDQWRALFIMIINLWVCRMLGNYRVTAHLAASREGFSFME